MSNDKNKAYLKAIGEYKKQLTDIIKTQYDKFDQRIIFIAGGGFTISAVVIDKIIPIETAVGKTNLFVALSIFASVVILGLIAHYVSIRANSWALENISELDYATFRCIMYRWNFVIKTINYITIILLIVGSTFLLYFINLNIFK